MRQMVLNHASVRAGGSSRETVTHWLVDLSKGMAKLVDGRVVESQLRTEAELYETPCLASHSLYDAFLGLRAAGYREQYRFLMSLATKSPLLRDTPAGLKDRFLGCEGISVPLGGGGPLVLCALANWIAVGLPSAPSWHQDQLTVQFSEMLSDETFSVESEVVDNLTRYEHAAPIDRRHSERLAVGSDPADLWRNRRTYFPHILFGPEVEAHLRAHATLFDTVVGKLIAINRSAAEWKTRGGAGADLANEGDRRE